MKFEAAALIDRFRIGEIYGVRNHPAPPVAEFAIRPGRFTAPTDNIAIEAAPHGANDLAASRGVLP